MISLITSTIIEYFTIVIPRVGLFIQKMGAAILGHVMLLPRAHALSGHRVTGFVPCGGSLNYFCSCKKNSLIFPGNIVT